jgi:hypothetical protein
MAPWNFTNISSAITDEAKNPPTRAVRIDANKLFFMTVSPFGNLVIENISVVCDCAGAPCSY